LSENFETGLASDRLPMPPAERKSGREVGNDGRFLAGPTAVAVGFLVAAGTEFGAGENSIDARDLVAEKQGNQLWKS